MICNEAVQDSEVNILPRVSPLTVIQNFSDIELKFCICFIMSV